VNCYQELCIELWSVINFHREIEPANLLQYNVLTYDILDTFPSALSSHIFRVLYVSHKIKI
jgi:hypothetical protein